MKKQHILLLILLLSSMKAGTQELNKRLFDPQAGREILIDQVDVSGLKQQPFLSWYEHEYQSYAPNPDLIEELLVIDVEGIEIQIVLGTWCGDSQREVPRFLKILEEIVFPGERISMIAVNRLKKADAVDIDALEIQKVPTFIVYRQGEELGRIIEYPQDLLEADLLKILSKED
jgi:thiol-disulfide isomerase/thioredoxin